MTARRRKQTETIQENIVNENDFDTSAPDLDVDAPVVVPDAEDSVEAPTAEDKPAKEKKESTRPAVPEGYISPVQLAKELTTELRSRGLLDEDKTVAPQVVYSYIKNNPKNGKNPFPQYAGTDLGEDGQPIAPGRAVVVKRDEAIEWWIAKIDRVKASKTAAAEKAAKKAEKAKGDETVSETPAEQAELVEAE